MDSRARAGETEILCQDRLVTVSDASEERTTEREKGDNWVSIMSLYACERLGGKHGRGD